MQEPQWLERVIGKALELYQSPPSSAIEAARKALADTLAVASAAPQLNKHAARIASEVISYGTGRAIVPGLWVKASRLEAAVATALLAHSIELDDWLAPAYTHVGTVAVPVLVAQADRVTLGEAYRILIAAYEVALGVGSALGRNHYRVWHTTATVGAAVAATTWLLSSGISEAKALASAVEASLAYASGLWSVVRSTPIAKPLSPANAVATGSLAAEATRQGIRVAGAIEELCRLSDSGCNPLEPGEPAILLNGFKLYPACRHTHTAIEAAEKLSKRVGEAQSISWIEVRVFEEAARVAGRGWPSTRSEAFFSLRYLVAVALRYGRLGITEIDKGMHDQQVKRLYDVTRIVVEDEYTRAYPWKQPATIRVATRDKQLEEHVEIPLGDPARPASLKDILAKAESLSRGLGDDRIRLVAEYAARESQDKPLIEVLEAAMKTRHPQ